MNTYTNESFKETNTFETFEYKQKFKQKRNKPESDNKVKPSHCRVGRDLKRNVEG